LTGANHELPFTLLSDPDKKVMIGDVHRLGVRHAPPSGWPSMPGVFMALRLLAILPGFVLYCAVLLLFAWRR